MTFELKERLPTLSEANPAKVMQYVHTGEICCGGAESILNSGAIGSCVVITALDPIRHVGAMAHVMLPSECPVKNHAQANRYAANAIEEMLHRLQKLQIVTDDMEICLAGGANVLRRDTDTIGHDNLNSVEQLLLEKHFEIKARTTGGYERRTVLFDIGSGCVYYTEGDSKQKMLWQTGSR